MTDPLARLVPPEIAAKLQAARRTGSGGERRIVTALFCDVKGSTAAAEQLDPEEWTEIMNELFAVLIGPVYRYEGVVARLMGDAVLAFFGAPIAHEDDPARAVLVGLEILEGVRPQRERLRRQRGLDLDARVGINTGLAVVGEVGSDLRVEYTAMGDAVNLAARMEQTAEPGTVRIAEDTYRLVAPLFECEPLGAVEVKGKREPVAAYRVIARRARPGSLRGLAGVSAPLVGRDAELAALRGALDALAAGRGGLVGLVAEAGLGKSRLIAEMRATWSGRWSESRAVAYERTRPYAQLERHLRELAGVDSGDIATLLGLAGSGLAGEALKREIARATVDRVRSLAAEGPIVFVFDDAHWTDVTTVGLLAELFALRTEVPVLFVVATRPDADPSVLALLEVPDARRLQLRPLGVDAADALAAALVSGGVDAAERRALASRADGNPFFLEELVRARAESARGTAVPATLQGLLLARIDALAPEPRRTLQVASVIGRTFSRAVLGAVAAPDGALDRDLAALERAALVVSVPAEQYAFRHALTQDAAYSSLLLRERRELHRRVGDELERVFGEGADTEASLLGHHFFEAGDARAVRYERVAGDAAARLYANAEAAAHFRRAIDASKGELERDVAIHLYTQLGRALELEGRYEDAARTYEELERTAVERSDRRLELAALSAHATLRSFFNPLHDPERAAELLGRAAAIASEIGDAEAEARILWTLMLQLAIPGTDPRRAAEHGERAEEIARELGLREQLAFVLNDLHHAYGQLGRIERSRRAGAEARGLWEELGNKAMLADNLATEAMNAFLMGEYDGAVASAQRAHALSREIGNRWGESYSLRAIGAIAIERGDVAKGLDTIAEMMRIGEEAGLTPVLMLMRGELALTHAALGDIETARRLVALALEHAETLPRSIPTVRSMRARVEVRAGDLAAARAALAGAEHANLDDWEILGIYAGVARAELALAAGDPSAALASCDDILTRMGRAGVRLRIDGMLDLKARALRAAGRDSEAAVVWRDALAAADALETRWARWRILAGLGRRDDARGVLRAIVENVPDPLRARFTALPEVRDLLA
ncbi:MAG TPA: adenylate/guanylate cyclase domain-containing protein [Candidatus Limnocylindria bacterium]|nr:adenylate/guanylate cyclase domain-containing protein [Candidatus Limnocylindria bacterium]